MPTAASVLTNWSLFTGLVLCLGAVAGRWVVLPRARVLHPAPLPGLEARAARLGGVGALLLLAALGLVFLRQLLEFRDPFAPWTEDATLLLTGTPWGSAWRWAVAGAVVAAAAFPAAARGRAAAWWIASPAALALGAFPAFTGHAAATEGLRPLTLTADTLHVWAAGGWLGALTLVLALDAGWRRRAEAGADGGDPLPALVAAFSPLAVACVGTLLVTGTVAAWVQLPQPAALVSGAWGRILLLKVALALGAFGLGAVNWRRLTPRLGEPAGAAALRRAAAAEILLAHAVLLATALLVRTPPAPH